MPSPFEREGEPDPNGKAVYKFADDSMPVIGDTLGEVREGIDDVEPEIIEGFAFRANLVLNAGRFKRSPGEVEAPTRQEEVFARVRELAEAQDCSLPGFADLMVDVYRFVVPRFVELQQKAVNDMIPVEHPPQEK